MNISFRIVKSTFCGLILSAAAFNAQADAYEDGLMAFAIGNYAEAGQHLMSAAEGGNTGAEHMLMRMFSEGKLFAKDIDQETLKWTRKAAEKGIKQAQYALAEIYASKHANAKDAVEWYRKAANQGHPDAYYKLGEIYKDGAKNIESDSNLSTHMYQIAASEFDVYAQQGDAGYQYTLAGMYQHAKGVKKNMKLALKWLEKSALQGHALAQISLGRLYALGEDVPRDTHQAKFWLEMAAAQGMGEAIALLEKINNTNNANVAFAM